MANGRNRYDQMRRQMDRIFEDFGAGLLHSPYWNRRVQPHGISATGGESGAD